MLNTIKKQILYYLTTIIVLYGVILSCTKKVETPTTSTVKPQDSIAYYIQSYKKLATDTKTQNQYLLKAKTLNNDVKNDTLKKYYSLKIAIAALNNNDTLVFKSSNRIAYKLAIKLKDTSAIAETHWNLGDFYGNKQVSDSSYHHYIQAYNYYEKIKNDNYSAKMLYNVALIESRFKNYLSSENKLFEAIEKYKSINKQKLYQCYKLLGNIYSESGDFKSSLEYHNMAIESIDKDDKKSLYEKSLNDIGIMYQIRGDHKNAVSFFNKALKNKALQNKNIWLYAILKDNIAYSMLQKGDTTQVKNLLLEALKIREQLDYDEGISINNLHLVEYYLKIQDTANALSYAKKANSLAKEIKNNNHILKSLVLLSKTDKANSSKYLQQHIDLSDAIETKEKKLTNRFARIRFETDAYIEANEKLTIQKELITTIGVNIVLVLGLLFFITIQRSKNKQLQLEKNQRKANEEIYSLMLKQQSKLEEGRINERNRISEELHDGILGKIFGTRMGLAFLNIKCNESTQKQYQKFVAELQNIEKEMRIISHDLKNEILTSKSDFVSIIEEFLKNQTKIAGLQYSINKDSSINWNIISDNIKINIYRVIQEAIQNSIKHANATAVKVKLNIESQSIKLTIEDNGKGFIKLKKKGIGLTNMRSRIKSLNGNFEIEDTKGIGVKIKVEIPVEYEQLKSS